MEEQKTDNELIAEFMGFTKYSREGAPASWWSVPKGEDLKYKAFKLDSKKFLYDTSWDWLMPVVEKIEKLEYSFSIVNNQANIIADSGDNKERWLEEYPNKLQSVYATVVEFIKWYNKNK